MTKIILVGCNGKMGSYITASIADDANAQIVAGVDKFHGIDRDYPVYDSILDINETADVIIDFSNPETCASVLEYSQKNNVPAVLCTTGLSEKQLSDIEMASKNVAIFNSFNMSLGINLLTELAKKAASVLGNSFDIEVIEQHHNQKIDAPSGTAFMLANAINETLDNSMQYKYDRHSTRAKREKNEIGIHSIRGGNIVGEHEVIFAGTDEVISISHSARSKEVFATGAINAAKFMVSKPAGMYSMKELLG